MSKQLLPRAKLSIETLEDRLVPATLTYLLEAPEAPLVQVELAQPYKQSGQQSGPAFEIKDFSFSVENPTTIGSATGGAGAGKVEFNIGFLAAYPGRPT
jgi:hypothetical protein